MQGESESSRVQLGRAPSRKRRELRGTQPRGKAGGVLGSRRVGCSEPERGGDVPAQSSTAGCVTPSCSARGRGLKIRRTNLWRVGISPADDTAATLNISGSWVYFWERSIFTCLPIVAWFPYISASGCCKKLVRACQAFCLNTAKPLS